MSRENRYTASLILTVRYTKKIRRQLYFCNALTAACLSSSEGLMINGFVSPLERRTPYD